MNRTHISKLLALGLIAAWGFTGCASPTSDTTADDMATRTQTVDLDDPYGGYNLADESPMFGDASMAVYDETSVSEVDDNTDNDPSISPDRARRYLMITWGNLKGDSVPAFATEWSGSLTVDNGVVAAKRTIRFEPNDGLLPRTSRDKLEWVSFTKPHFDGIIVALHKVVTDTTDTLAVDAAQPQLVVNFETTPLKVSFTEEELRDLHQVFEVDDAGNAVAFNVITVEPQACPAGFMAGAWRNVEDRPGGVFRGKWISHSGLHMGYLKGVYGHTSAGENVFFGKIIARNGRFEGLMKGLYGAHNDGQPGGWYRGVWIGRALRAQGDLGGNWVTSDDIDGGGYFRGKWQRHCL